MTTHTGHCVCGKVSFEIKDLTTDCGACHCETCRRWTGSALLAVTVPEDKMSITGEDNVTVYQSSDWATRSFCASCGSNLWYRLTADGPHKGVYHMAAGLLDDMSGLTMTSEIFIDSKPDTFAYAGDLKQMTGAEVFAQFAPPEGT